MTKEERMVRRKLRKPQRMTVTAFWSDCAVRVISYLCALILMTIVLSVVLPVSTQLLTNIADVAAIVLAVLWCIPVIRNTRRRLRDTDHTAKAYLWLLLPVIGWIVFVALLCKKGKQLTPEESEHFIDTWEC